MNVLILDVETNGLDPEQHDVVEAGCILYNVKHASMLEVYSSVLAAEHNEAAEINGIPEPTLRLATDAPLVWEAVSAIAEDAVAYVAHNATFDRSFCSTHVPDKPWICTIEDFEWPKQSPSKTLVATALAHGVGVVSAHRAITDCLTMALCFDRIADIKERMSKALKHAKLPKATMVAKVRYEDRQIAKDHGFRWDPDAKKWKRTMAVEDAKKLPFPTAEE